MRTRWRTTTFNELDRDLTAEERQEWNSIYASYRGRSALTGTIIGVDPLHISVRNKETGEMERKTMYCAIVVPYRVRVVIPDTEMWEQEQARPDFVLQNMVASSSPGWYSSRRSGMAVYRSSRWVRDGKAADVWQDYEQVVTKRQPGRCSSHRPGRLLC